MDSLTYNMDRMERGRFATQRVRTQSKSSRKPKKSSHKSNNKSSKQLFGGSKTMAGKLELQYSEEEEEDEDLDLSDILNNKLNIINERIDSQPKTLHQNEKIEDIDMRLKTLMDEVESIKNVQLKLVETLTRLVTEINNVKSRLVR